jgi:hypothetical protein
MIEVKMTPAEYDAAGDRLFAQQGLTMTGSSGTLSKSGFTATYQYDGVTFKAQVVKKPFMFTMNYCEAKLVQWLELSAASVN